MHVYQHPRVRTTEEGLQREKQGPTKTHWDFHMVWCSYVTNAAVTVQYNAFVDAKVQCRERDWMPDMTYGVEDSMFPMTSYISLVLSPI